MGTSDHVTRTGKSATAPAPRPTCGLDSTEAAEGLPQRRISEQLPESCQLIVQAYNQTVNISILCILLVLMVAAVVARYILGRPAHNQASAGGRVVRAAVVAAPTGNLVQLLDSAESVPADADGASSLQRGKCSATAGSTSGSTNAARAEAKAQSASAHADSDQPLAACDREPQSGEINENIIDNTRTEHTHEPVQNAPGPKRGSSNALHQTSPPEIDRARFGSGFYRPITLFVGQFTATFSRYWANGPLGRSLYGRGPTFSIFAIAGDGAERDIQALHRALTRSYPVHVRFVSLSQYITLDDFGAEIKRLYDECKDFPNTHLFIYLTGHGDWQNRMVASESQTLSATRLFGLLSGPTIPVTILFDICRKGRAPSAIPPEGVSLIWTASLEETAGACRIPNSNSPESCFLIALMMSARTPGLQYTSDALKEMVQGRLDQLMAFLGEVYSLTHTTDGRCPNCLESLEPCDKPTGQKIDWQHANSVDGLLELTRILSDSDIAEEVYERFMGDAIFLRVNNLSNPKALHSIVSEGGGKPGLSSAVAATPNIAPDFGPLPDDHTDRHERGANEPVHAASTPMRG
ncbi:hypothetical protein RSOLAG22IIIB_03556 [Rhizoctonia solani]|uniref:Uncharacterized protein n=1 Tax=Rhizoctonia solani TaxID=456999 RepID=A0A0K6FQQ2_9AGAM|nr:hypothetical protein RSOLAG22IIIB_03556 [Rhizoctonia solani]